MFIYSNYEKVLIAGDFNAEILEICLNSFLFEHDLKNLVNKKTCFKIGSNPSYIDLLLNASK